MKILIIYASKNGVAKKAAERLSDELCASHEIAIYDINDTPPAPNDFDVIVLGGSIYMTKLNKKLKAYLKKHIEEIVQEVPKIHATYQRNDKSHHQQEDWIN